MQGILTQLPVFVVIAGLASGLALSLFNGRSFRFILVVASFVVLVAAVAGWCLLLRSRHLSAAVQKELAFLVERSVEWRAGQNISLDFTPTTNHYYKVSLFFPQGAILPAPEAFSVECSVYEDRKLFTEGSGPPWTSLTSNAAGTQAELCFFPGKVGASYHISFDVRSAAADLNLRSARLIVTNDPQILGEHEWDALLTGGVGVTLWLAAYGVFVAAAIRIALNWRQAADRRAFLAGPPAA